MKEFLDTLDAWQIANGHVRVTAATFPGAEQKHSTVYSGFNVSDGPSQITINTGEQIAL